MRASAATTWPSGWTATPSGFTQMGGEGANWVGECNFSKRGHVFQNLGDGTYNHSGSLALRWAVDTKTNVTYKILFNDAVAMTGGQPHEGGLTVDMIARQVRAEGVERIALVTDEPKKYPKGIAVAVGHDDPPPRRPRRRAARAGASSGRFGVDLRPDLRGRKAPPPQARRVPRPRQARHHQRSRLRGVRRLLGAIELRRCAAGRDRVRSQADQIDQSNCNKDFSCVKGFCPSFVTVHGAKMQEGGARDGLDGRRCRSSRCPSRNSRRSTAPSTSSSRASAAPGVVTIGAILGMAAHLEGKGMGMIDMAGLAQKGGAVYSHVRLANTPGRHPRHPRQAGAAHLMLGCDLVVTGTKKVLASVKKGRTALVVNTAEVMPGDFTRNADFSLPAERIKRAIMAAAGREGVAFVDATAIATALLGNAIAANMFMLGYAYQSGRVPLSACGHPAARSSSTAKRCR